MRFSRLAVPLVLLACVERPPAVRADLTALAESVAQAIGNSSEWESEVGYSALRTAGGPTPWDTLVGVALRSQFPRAFVADDDSVYVRRIATTGIGFHGDTAVVLAVSAICVRPRRRDDVTWRSTSQELRFVPDENRWRAVAPGNIAVADGACSDSVWHTRWW